MSGEVAVGKVKPVRNYNRMDAEIRKVASGKSHDMKLAHRTLAASGCLQARTREAGAAGFIIRSGMATIPFSMGNNRQDTGI